MYNVILVDDDYPVLELLSEAIGWEELGLQLTGMHENGQAAWEQAQEALPDIVITDIGMPKMNGLELIERLKERKANIRFVILSCHSEFQFAQQAMRLNVQDYLLKDALDPAELEMLLRRVKESLDAEAQMNWQQSRLKHMVDETKELRKEQWLKNFIEQPLLSPQDWLKEAQNNYGLLAEEMACLPVIGFLEGYSQAKRRFLSDQTLRFAVNNVMDEVLQAAELPCFHTSYGNRESFLLFSFRPGIKTNVYDQIGGSLKAAQDALQWTLKLRISFILGEPCSTPETLRPMLGELVGSRAQRFYLEEGDIAKRRPVTKQAYEEVFTDYDLASTELRESVIGKRPEAVKTVVERWTSQLKAREYAPETVKDWMLKLLLDLKLKLQSLQFMHPGYSADTLHKEIAEIDSLSEMKHWLIEHLEAVSLLVGTARTSMRAEVVEACKYVSLHLDRRISLEEVSEHLHLNASYFSRMFKKETGESFIEYVTRMKMERAKELLDRTSHSVGKICELLGYDNQSYFIKIFKSHTGVTPVEYRG
ncbi:response regulator [Paenibacillus cremeus]|uniref:Response regulator n=2 Tax=Paenibacillus cremeus TaxID=2163881 RepID=A0A559JK52_9BACL|nr:response regulator [Paenibacillus cremeus]